MVKLNHKNQRLSILASLLLFFLALTVLQYEFIYVQRLDFFQFASDPSAFLDSIISNLSRGYFFDESWGPIVIWSSICSLFKDPSHPYTNLTVYLVCILTNSIIATFSALITCVCTAKYLDNLSCIFKPVRHISITFSSLMFISSPIYILSATILIRDIFTVFAGSLLAISVLNIYDFKQRSSARFKANFFFLFSICLILTFSTRLEDFLWIITGLPLSFLFSKLPLFHSKTHSSQQYKSGLKIKNLPSSKLVLLALIAAIILLLVVFNKSLFEIFNQRAESYANLSQLESRSGSVAAELVSSSNPFIKILYGLFVLFFQPGVFIDPFRSHFSFAFNSAVAAKSLSIIFSIMTAPLFLWGSFASLRCNIAYVNPIKILSLFTFLTYFMISLTSIEYRHTLITYPSYLVVCLFGFSCIKSKTYYQLCSAFLFLICCSTLYRLSLS